MPEKLVPDHYGVLDLLWRGVGDPEVMVSSVCFKFVEADEDDLTSHAGLLRDAFITAMDAGEMAETWSFEGTQVRHGPLGVGPVEIAPDHIVGTHGGGTSPSNCSLLIKKLTQRGGRRGRGRMFFPAAYCFEAAVDNNGMLLDAQRSQYQTSMSAFLEECQTGGSAGIEGLFLAHTVPDGGDPDEFMPTHIESLIVAPQIATQRRRMRR